MLQKVKGFGNKFLANIREVDAIVHVVRAFDDENVMREQGREDAIVIQSQILIPLTYELILADLRASTSVMPVLKKWPVLKKTRILSAEFTVLEKIKPVLEDGKSTVPYHLLMKNKRL